MPSILAAFGAEYATQNGALDRVKMRRLIIEDASAKAGLEQILHPMILDACKKRLQEQALYHVLVAPLLLEAPDFLNLSDRVLLVDCSEQNQIARVMQRGALSDAEIRAIIALQLPREERIKRADDIIRNDGTREELEKLVKALHPRYLDLADNHLTAD